VAVLGTFEVCVATFVFGIHVRQTRPIIRDVPDGTRTIDMSRRGVRLVKVGDARSAEP